MSAQNRTGSRLEQSVDRKHACMDGGHTGFGRAHSVIAIGTDIIECQRIARMLADHGEVFVRRVFTAAEIDYCSGRKMDYQHYAARWAAKEAVLKTLGTGWAQGIFWTDVELTNLPGGKPIISLYNRADQVAKEIGISEVLITVSHTCEYAVAFATAVGQRLGD